MQKLKFTVLSRKLEFIGNFGPMCQQYIHRVKNPIKLALKFSKDFYSVCIRIFQAMNVKKPPSNLMRVIFCTFPHCVLLCTRPFGHCIRHVSALMYVTHCAFKRTLAPFLHDFCSCLYNFPDDSQFFFPV